MWDNRQNFEFSVNSVLFFIIKSFVKSLYPIINLSKTIPHMNKNCANAYFQQPWDHLNNRPSVWTDQGKTRSGTPR